MNGFPYWQFHNERWLTGKVSSLDLDAQGLFLYFCMAAWASRGAFNICSTSVRLRFRKSAEWIAETVGVMIEIGVLIKDGEKYRIKFIDDQIAEMNEIRRKRSKAGKASAESRQNTKEEDNTKEEVRKGKVSSVLECVQHPLNTCSTLVDENQPPHIPPPITEQEAIDRADRIGLSAEEARECWTHYQSEDWILKSGHRMSREAAFAKLGRWKTRKHEFDAKKKLLDTNLANAEDRAAKSKPVNYLEPPPGKYDNMF